MSKYHYMLYCCVKWSKSSCCFWPVGSFSSLAYARKKADSFKGCYMGKYYIRRYTWAFSPDKDCTFYYFCNGNFLCKTTGFRASLNADGELL